MPVTHRIVLDAGIRNYYGKVGPCEITLLVNSEGKVERAIRGRVEDENLPPEIEIPILFQTYMQLIPKLGLTQRKVLTEEERKAQLYRAVKRYREKLKRQQEEARALQREAKDLNKSYEDVVSHYAKKPDDGNEERNEE